MVHVAHFLAEPLVDLPARRSDSRRRTISVDMVGAIGGRLELIGLAHGPDGDAISVDANVAPDRTLTSLDINPPDADTRSLLGLPVGRGFRAAVDAICTPETLEAVLLCELPVAALLSGYGTLYTGHMPGLTDEFMATMPVDICAGWISDGTMMSRTRVDRMVPTPDGPAAPLGIDAEWHDMPPLAPNTMRRQRLIDRSGDQVWAMFRDTYARVDGQVIVLHEYTVDAVLEPTASGSRIKSLTATPHVLPWGECPSAAASAAGVVGTSVASLRARVKDDLVGISTCTHLNDLLASLAQVDAIG